MRILVIIHSYPPANDPRAFRWSAICEYWAERGINVDVICANSKANALTRETLKGVTIYRETDFSQIYRSNDLSIHNSQVLMANSWKMLCKQKMYSLVKKALIFFRWPDFAWLWIPKAYKQASYLLKNNPYNGLVTVAVPFSSHIVGMLLMRQGKNIPWLCDYGDPFSFLKELPMNNIKLYKWLNKYIEHKIISQSKLISVTTIETMNEYVSYLRVPKNWFQVIPPLVKNNYIYPVEPSKRNLPFKDGRIHLLFAGTLYSKIRNPAYLLKLLSLVKENLAPCNFALHFYGKIEGCEKEFELYKNAINDWIFLHGMIEKEALIETYKNIDILVNIGNTTSYQVPSKVIEYISTGLPVLHVTSKETDSSLPILKDYPNAFCLNGEFSQTIIENLGVFIRSCKQVNKDIVDKILEKYQLPEIANSYLNFLRDNVT